MFSLVLAEASSRSQNFASFEVHPWQWALFIGFIAVLVIADLLLVHRTAHEITFKEAAIESSIGSRSASPSPASSSGGTAAWRPRSTSPAT